MEELLDVLDEAGEPTGETKPRGEVHRVGDLHRALHVWIVREGRYVLFQRRAAGKDLEPGKLDVSVGGHLSAGEMVRDAARELEEELGLNVAFEDLHYLGSQRSERRYPGATDREIAEVYVLAYEQVLEDYALNPAEVAVLYELPLDGALGLYRDGRAVAAAGWDAQGRPNHALLSVNDLIAQGREEVVAALEWIRVWLQEGGAGRASSS